MEFSETLMYQLESRRLRVTLAPSKDYESAMRGQKIRVVDEQNPRWYQDFCAEWTANRTKPRHRKKLDTLIKRCHTIRALRELASGRCQSQYAQRLLPFVQDEYKLFVKNPERWSFENAFT